MKNATNAPENAAYTSESAIDTPKKLLCFSHLRWDLSFQRPQHLLNRFAKDMEVFYFEGPLFDAVENNYLSVVKREDQLSVLVPHLKYGLTDEAIIGALGVLLDHFLEQENLEQANQEQENQEQVSLQQKILKDWLFWFYTPMAYSFCSKHTPKLIVYDCVDGLSDTLALPVLTRLEKSLMAAADLVFTEGHSLFEAKQNDHRNIFPFPNSVDVSHFAKARKQSAISTYSQKMSRPKIGFFGLIDERFDIELVRGIANLRPQWQIELIGPIARIDAGMLPQNENIHYLGAQSYEDLPMYLSGWDIGLIPFALNESTRFISPTKTSEYLAAGIPVVSTPIRDVIKPYGIARLVRICASARSAVREIEAELKITNKENWLACVDDFLKDISWDNTYAGMRKQIAATLKRKQGISVVS